VKELELLAVGQHPRYLEKVDQLNAERELREWMADKWKNYSLNCCEQIVTQGKKDYQQQLQISQNEIKENLVKQCVDQRKKLEDIGHEPPHQPRLQPEQRPVTRRLLRARRREEDGTAEDTYEPSCVAEIHQYMRLNEREVRDDLAAIHKAIKVQQTI